MFLQLELNTLNDPFSMLVVRYGMVYLIMSKNLPHLRNLSITIGKPISARITTVVLLLCTYFIVLIIVLCHMNFILVAGPLKTAFKLKWSPCLCKYIL